MGLPRKFKINFSGCVTDCGQAMFNDVGVVAVARPLPDGTTEAGFRVFVAGGLGANPHPAQALEEFTPREELLATLKRVRGERGRFVDEPVELAQPRVRGRHPLRVTGRRAILAAQHAQQPAHLHQRLARRPVG